MNALRNIQKRIKSESQRLYNIKPLDRNRHLFHDPTMRIIVQKY